jgi:hypothetical protein
MTERDPLPFPRLQNDDNFLGKNKPLNQSFNSSGGSKELNDSIEEEKVVLTPGEPTPWVRLAYNKTLSSMRREVYHYDPISPHDHLDFALRVEYNQQLDCSHSKAEAVIQPETAREDHGRILKNRPVVVEPMTLEKKELVKYDTPRTATIDCAKGLSIESHHSEATNRGYSRKKDGGFYCT